MTPPNPAYSFHIKVAIVTGAASGFGQAVVELSASHSWFIVAANINAEELHSHFSADSSRQLALARVDRSVARIVANMGEKGEVGLVGEDCDFRTSWKMCRWQIQGPSLDSVRFHAISAMQTSC